ncbi:MAG: OmpW family outer membrane protein, partial [Pseudomonadota bacterium]
MTFLKTVRTGVLCTLTALGGTATLPQSANAGDYTGDFMVRILGAGVITQDNVNSLTANGADISGVVGAEITGEFIPAATLTYFFTPNIAAELFCCFATHQINTSGAVPGEVADFWIFPPAVTLQYHFNPTGGFKPYVGAGVQYIHFFDEGTGSNALDATGVDIDDAFGFTLQAGFDVELGGGLYFNADIKKTWLSTDARWTNSVVGTVDADVDV